MVCLFFFDLQLPKFVISPLQRVPRRMCYNIPVRGRFSVCQFIDLEDLLLFLMLCFRGNLGHRRRMNWFHFSSCSQQKLSISKTVHLLHIYMKPFDASSFSMIVGEYVLLRILSYFKLCLIVRIMKFGWPQLFEHKFIILVYIYFNLKSYPSF